MSESRDPKTVLREQIDYWEAQKREAEEQLRVASAVLPGLHDSLKRLEGEELEEVEEQREDVVTKDKKQLTEETGNREEHGHLRGADDVGRIVEQIIPELPKRFTQAEVDNRLTDRGYNVNRSTLRTALQLMATLGAKILVEEQGRGRRATIFQKV